MANYIFVYGTLMSSFNTPEAVRLRNESKFIGKASVKGSLYDTGSYPALVFDSKEKVFGELYEILNHDTLEWLDTYEEVPVLYIRRKIKAKCNDVKYECYVYEYTGHVYKFNLIEGGSYLKAAKQNI
jgi:gamma-glutamylcyclotransferase (GGCT)/AIG2-like uncharacterized protein YtfP